MKYKLSTILLKMRPCDDARWWILNVMNFDTLEEAIRACPRSKWLSWVLLSIELADDPFSKVLTDEMWMKIRRYRRDLEKAESEAAVTKLFLSPEYLDRFAYALIQYAKREGIEPYEV